MIAATSKAKAKAKHVDIVFPGAAFAFPYYSGIVAYLQDTFGRAFFKENDNISISCVSAGTWNGAILALGLDIRKAHELNREIITNVMTFPLYARFNAVYKHLNEKAIQIFMDEDVKTMKKNKLRVSVSEITYGKSVGEEIPKGTNFTPYNGKSLQVVQKIVGMKQRVYTSWKNAAELIECLTRSSYIPPFALDKETWNNIQIGEKTDGHHHTSKDRNTKLNIYMDGIHPPQTIMQNISKIFPFHTRSSREMLNSVHNIKFSMRKMRGYLYNQKYWLPIYKLQDFDKLFSDGYEDAEKLDASGEFDVLYELLNRK